MRIVGENKFVWPEKDDISWYENDDVVCTVEPPAPVSQRAFGLSKKDVEKIKALQR